MLKHIFDLLSAQSTFIREKNLAAILNCSQPVLSNFLDWKYYMNVAGTELPLIGLNQLSHRMKESVVASRPLKELTRLNDQAVLQRFHHLKHILTVSSIYRRFLIRSAASRSFH